MGRKRRPRTQPLDDYTVGYGRPPAHSQFKPGQSGNPHGRPKGAANLTTLIAKAMNEKVVVQEGGRRRTITKAEAAAKQLTNKAASGDLRAIRELRAAEESQLRAAEAEKRSATPEQEIPPPQAPQIDFSKMSTRDLMILHEAAMILEGNQEAPPPPMPPADPEDASQ